MLINNVIDNIFINNKFKYLKKRMINTYSTFIPIVKNIYYRNDK